MTKVLLTILDGWGENNLKKEYNAIEVGNTPNWKRILKDNPNSHLVTFGEEVGLPSGQMGNSEVGHTNIGAGRIIFQDLPRINNAIKDNSFKKNESLIKTAQNLKQNNNTIHIMGLVSDGGIHSHIDHFLASIDFFAEHKIKTVLHLFTDGRDTPPNSAVTYVKTIEDFIQNKPDIKIGSISGRYYAMDRDNRWERVALAYEAIVNGKGDKIDTPQNFLQASYAKNVNDEFIVPGVMEDYKGIQDGDSIFMTNFRTDRVREILNAIVLPDFEGFQKNKLVKFTDKLGLVEYSDVLNQHLDAIFKPNNISNSLGQWLEKQGKTQLRVAETEKYPHVTFFFSCGQEEPFKGEERILIPSPKVATYDMQPEMSAYEITDNLTKALDSKKYDFIVVNYANGDMVGHTGSLEAAAKAAEAVDSCLAKVEKSVMKNDYIWLIIADHGNCEQMWDEKNNTPHTQHTTNLVNAILVNNDNVKKLKDGKLADVAPTILDLLKIEKPQEMEGKSLVEK